MKAFLKIFWGTIDRYKTPIALFCMILFLLIGCTLPKVFINDEWITLNQISQLDLGHQVITNEGKYGTLENGTPYEYFQARGNYLGYSIFLPLISLPALKSLTFFNDTFLYILMVFWTLLLIAMSLFIRIFFPNLAEFHGYNLTNFTIILAFVLFFLNLVFYQPFFFIGKNTYAEIAAIALTNMILLSLLAVILFQIYHILFESEKISLSATILTICCSSFIFWTTNAKDHILIALLFSVLIYCGIKYIFTGNRWYIPGFFIIIGLIAWARVEIAPPLFVVFSLLVVNKCVRKFHNTHDLKESILLSLTPIFTLIGAIPFFINNYYVTGNFLSPPMLFYSEMSSWDIDTKIVDSINDIVPSALSTLPINQNGFTHVFALIAKYYSVSPGTSGLGIARLFFLPTNHSIGVFVICPLLLIGLIGVIFSKITWKNFSKPEKKTFYFLILLIVIIFFSYLPSLYGMNLSSGITPDVRYFSPMYIPVGILGLILIKKSGMIPDFSKNGISVLLFTGGEVVCVLIGFLWMFIPSDKNFHGFTSIITDTITCIVYALVILFILFNIFIKNGDTKNEYCTLLIHAIIVVPFVWQMAIIFSSFAGIGLNGYTYWIPVIREPMQQILTLILHEQGSLSTFLI